MNTRVRYKQRNQKVKMLKSFNFHYDTETYFCENYTTVY